MATARRRTTRRRKSSRKKQWYKRKYNAFQLAAKAAKGVWYLKGLVNSELFKFDGSLGLQGTSPTGASWLLTAIPEGDAYNQRTGISVFMRSLYVRLMYNYNTAGIPTNGDQWVNMYIVQDNQQFADAVPTMNTLITNPGNMIAALQPQLSGRFSILLHEKFVLRPTTPQTKIIEKYFNMRHHVKFNGPASTDIQKGGIYLMVASSTASGGPQFTAEWRTSYHDN